MGKHKKRKLDADRTDLDDQHKASFFCPPKRKRRKSQSQCLIVSLNCQSTDEVYDEVYQAQSNLSTAPPPNASNCTITLLVGLNTELYPLIFNTIEYQSYNIFDKKIRASLSQQTFC